MENPVDFLDAPDWRDPDEVTKRIRELEVLGFKVTPECCEIRNLELQALMLLHEDGNHFAVIYEDAGDGIWHEVGIQCQRCRIGRDAWGKKLFIATSAMRPKELEIDSTEIYYRPGTHARELLQRVGEISGDITAEKQDPMILGILLHERVMQKWQFVDQSQARDKGPADGPDLDHRISEWVKEFVEFFRPLGFLSSTKALATEALVKTIVDYDEPLFELCPGVHAVVDDFDEFSDLFDPDELDRLPESTQFLDLKILAILDPNRVWWAYRVWDFDQGYSESDVRIDGREFIGSLADISAGRFAPDAVRERKTTNDRSVIELVLEGEAHKLRNRYVPGGEALSRDAEVLAPDLGILSRLNKLLGPGGVGFHLFEHDDGESCFSSKYIVLLSKKERDTLRKNRGWKFT
ncbi:MAG: hypothetical protein R3174_08590 [Gammaproteobacteria bacterium]|nr:hypothetical protein [Gammaproteobacteria bacterium]